MIEREGALPGNPAIRVRVSLFRPYSDKIEVTYTGTFVELVRSGLLREDMTEKLRKQKRGMRRDSRGLPFSLWAKDRKLDSINDVHSLLWYSLTEEQALALPGVRALYPEGIQEVEESGRYRLTREDLARRFGASEYVERVRRVGRYQRPVQWAVIGNVIRPNWSRLLMDRA